MQGFLLWPALVPIKIKHIVQISWGFELRDEFEEVNSQKRDNASLSLLCVYLCPSFHLEMTNTIMLKLPDTYLFFDFKI